VPGKIPESGNNERMGIEARYEIKFLETGAEKDHAHFLVQSVPAYSPEKTVRTLKSLTARKIFEECPEVKKMLRGGEFWTGGIMRVPWGSMGMNRQYSSMSEIKGGNWRIIRKYREANIWNCFRIKTKREGQRYRRACPAVYSFLTIISS
jgi:hypothetical protein